MQIDISSFHVLTFLGNFTQCYTFTAIFITVPPKLSLVLTFEPQNTNYK